MVKREKMNKRSKKRKKEKRKNVMVNEREEDVNSEERRNE